MTADHLSYQRAASVSVVGMLVQALLAAGVLLYGIYGGDPAARAGAYLMLIGLGVWISLLVVFHQHKRERLEHLEAEAYEDSDAAMASAFGDEGRSPERVQANKLAWMHAWMLPTASILIGAAYVVVGSLLRATGEDVAEAEVPLPTQHGWAIATGLAVAAASFVLARFVAGMAKQNVWSLLNAGAASAVASSFIGLAIAASHFVASALGSDALLAILNPAVHVFMIVLGVEIFLNFVLTLYRPRKAGEYVRPAFDSRVLAFVAAPDRLAESVSDAINYQFGFEVSKTWFYRLVSRWIVVFVALGIAVIWVMSAFAVVLPNERALILANGRLDRVAASGVAVKWPYPFGIALKYPAEAVTQISVGTINTEDDETRPFLWTEDHGDEEYVFVRASASGVPGGAELSGLGGLELLRASIPVQYVVNDLEAYKLLAQDGPANDLDRQRRQTLEAIAGRELLLVMQRYPVNDVLGRERGAISQELQGLFQDAFDRANAGVTVLFTGLYGVHPPKDVAPAFENVIAADHRREAEIRRAQAEAIRTLAAVAGDVDRAEAIVDALDTLRELEDADADERSLIQQRQSVTDLIVSAGGDAATAVSEARADRWSRHMSERARAILSEGQALAMEAAPSAYLAGLYVDALQDALSGTRVWITPFEDVRVRIDQTVINPDVAGFRPAELDADGEE